MAQEVVYTVEGDADARRAADDAEFIAGISGASADYKAITVCWVTETRTRDDGKFTYLALPGADYTGVTLETYDKANYS